ncbi:hypothetical protein, partial [Salmonella sp. s51933]|uniref:hypothetical protein n=1 Tax=Salmonella sp. s51933 TaxID=3160127 RepID=UPI003753EC2F
AILNDRKEEELAEAGEKAEKEEKLLRDEELEGKAQETVDQITRLEKVMTVIEAAKYDAERRANEQLQIAEIWKSRMYGRAKKRSNIPSKDSVEQTSEENIRREKLRKRSAKK